MENTDKQFHLVLPPVPTDELSDEALDGVAGGSFHQYHHAILLNGLYDLMVIASNSGNKAELSRLVSIRAARWGDLSL